MSRCNVPVLECSSFVGWAGDSQPNKTRVLCITLLIFTLESFVGWASPTK